VVRKNEDGLTRNPRHQERHAGADFPALPRSHTSRKAGCIKPLPRGRQAPGRCMRTRKAQR
jgi:hypothetical protein